MWNPFHKHDYPLINADDTFSDVLVGDHWRCFCEKEFFMFTYKYNDEGVQHLVWREVGKFK